MNNAPKEIWAFYAPDTAEDNPGCTVVAGVHVMHGAQKYIRADWAASVEAHAAAILSAIEGGDKRAMMALAVACCHAEDAYSLVQHDGDAARHALGMAFLRSLAVGVPEHTA